MILDYYKILQVHHDASTEVIQSAYKRLSRMYHPDINNNQDDKMKQINIAFDVLSDTRKRSTYHREWLENYASVTTSRFSKRGTKSNEQAYNAIDEYFHYLKNESWENAYLKLTLEDQSRIPLEDFIDCKLAVSKSYQLQNYKINYYKTYFNCTIEDTMYEKIIEYAITVTDLNSKTYELNTETLHKYVVFNGSSWNVHLGQTTLKNSILKFTLISDKTEHLDPMSIYSQAIKRHDSLTGLLSKSGFYEEALKEINRYRRYNSPFSLIGFKIICIENVPETICICHAAGVLRNNLRINDVAARFSSNQLICLLVETKKAGAKAALQKLLNLILTTQNQKYDINTSVVEYSDFSNLDDAIYELCSASNIANNIIIDNDNTF